MQSFTTNYQKRWQKANQTNHLLVSHSRWATAIFWPKFMQKKSLPSPHYSPPSSPTLLSFFYLFYFFLESFSLKDHPLPSSYLSQQSSYLIPPLLDKFYTHFSLNFLDFFKDNPHFWSSFSLDLHLQKGKEKVKIHGWWLCNEQAYEKTVTCDVSDSVRSSRTEAGVPFDRDWHCISLFRSHPIISKSSWSRLDFWLIGWDNISSSSCASKNCIRATGWR